MNCSDSLKFIKELPNKSVNLILIDPPYNIGKAKWDIIPNYIQWMGEHFKEFSRILKDNGSFYFFHNDMPQIVDLMVELRKTDFVFKNIIVWDKSNIGGTMTRNSPKTQRKYLHVNEFILFYTKEDDNEKLFKLYGKDNFTNLRKYFDCVFIFCRFKNKKEAIMLHIGLHHCFNTTGQQWSLPTFKTYSEFSKLVNLKEMEGFRTYDDLKLEYDKCRYTFKNNTKKLIYAEFKKYKNRKNRIHSCQKPLKLIEDIIQISSNENDIVLDCFLGSGTTYYACENTNRICWGCEKSEKYFAKISYKI